MTREEVEKIIKEVMPDLHKELHEKMDKELLSLGEEYIEESKPKEKE